MTILDKLRKRFPTYGQADKKTDPEKAYNIWAQNYDAQPDNLMLKLETELFTGLLRKNVLAHKVIVDVGCGTGRHWDEILQHSPASLIGYDVSEGMLDKLKSKYPGAITYQLRDNRLPHLADGSCDIVISTLTMAHIQNIEEALTEWHRVLKPGGEMLLTDYHPAALTNNADRTFVHKNKLISITNYVHTVEKVLGIVLPLDFQIVYWDEKIIDDSVRHFYEEQHALHVFEKFKNVPIVYGAHLKKKNGTA